MCLVPVLQERCAFLLTSGVSIKTGRFFPAQTETDFLQKSPGDSLQDYSTHFGIKSLEILPSHPYTVGLENRVWGTVLTS